MGKSKKGKRRGAGAGGGCTPNEHNAETSRPFDQRTIAISPDGSLGASVGRDGKAWLWDVGSNKHLCSFDASGTVSAITFSPTHPWLCTATDTAIKIWDLATKCVLGESPSASQPVSGSPWCAALAWSADGGVLLAGSAEGVTYEHAVGPSGSLRRPGCEQTEEDEEEAQVTPPRCTPLRAGVAAAGGTRRLSARGRGSAAEERG